jgi:acetolactate synthase-1/2/3 large subunit
LHSQYAARPGGHLVVETLEALGAEVVFGLPGQHALAIFDALRDSELKYVGLRTELSAGFAAHGFATVTGRPAPLIVSTGPGALISLAALMEAASSSVPLLCISSDIPQAARGQGLGYVHELPDQLGTFRHVVKRAYHVANAETLPDILADAWREASSPPPGPVFIEIPVDVLTQPTAVRIVDGDISAEPASLHPRADVLDHVAEILESADTISMLAGGGVLRAEGWRELRELAERLDAPVLMTYGGKGAFPDDHALCAGSACEDAGAMRLLGDADVALVLGSSLSEESTNHFTLEFKGRLIQCDADAARIGNRYPGLAVAGDVRAVLQGLLQRLDRRPPSGGEQRANRARDRALIRLDSSSSGQELELLRIIRRALPAEGVHSWDMTILGYWASMAFPALSPRRYLWPQGSGSLGYGLPASLGASAAVPELPVVAVIGDGGAMYALQELTAAVQHGLGITLLIIDDGGYGVLKYYQEASYGRSYGVELHQPDFVELCRAYGVEARTTSLAVLEADLVQSFNADSPRALVLRAELDMFPPSHADSSLSSDSS